MFSFIENPEIHLLIQKTSNINKKKNRKDELTQQGAQKTISFTDRELLLLKKVNELEIVSEKATKSSDDEISARKKPNSNQVSPLLLTELKQLREELSKDGLYLCDIVLDQSTLQLPQNTIRERNPVLEERIQKLKAQQDQRAYKSMTKNVDSTRKFMPEDTIAFQSKFLTHHACDLNESYAPFLYVLVKQINRQLIAVAQFVFSVISGFFFGFLGIELIIGSLDFGFRLLLGIICALVIALAEIYFLAKKLNEEADAEEIASKVTTVSPSKKVN